MMRIFVILFFLGKTVECDYTWWAPCGEWVSNVRAAHFVMNYCQCIHCVCGEVKIDYSSFLCDYYRFNIISYRQTRGEAKPKQV